MGNPVNGQEQNLYPGQPVRASLFNRLYDSGQENQGVFPGPFDYGGRFPGGTVRIPNSSGSSAASKTTPAPWTPFFTQDGSGNYYANFYPGTVGGIVPSNMFSAITLTQGDVNYLYLEVTASAGTVTAATIAASTTYPTLASPVSGSAPTSFNVPIGIFDLTQSPPKCYNVVGFGNIWCQPYVTVFDTINTGAPLKAPFTPWFNWEWGAG